MSLLETLDVEADENLVYARLSQLNAQPFSPTREGKVLSTNERQFLEAAAELAIRQRELEPLVSAALGRRTYDYWILGHGRGDPALEAIRRLRLRQVCRALRCPEKHGPSSTTSPVTSSIL